MRFEERDYQQRSPVTIPKGPCTQIVDTLAPQYPNGDYFKAKVCTVWAHGPLGYDAITLTRWALSEPYCGATTHACALYSDDRCHQERCEGWCSRSPGGACQLISECLLLCARKRSIVIAVMPVDLALLTVLIPGLSRGSEPRLEP